MEQNADTVNSQLPLKGVVLCCTSLAQDVRIRISDAAIEMGAVHKLDLTSDITHLVVGSIATPKYQYVARERPDIKVLHPDWIKAVRDLWMEGGDVDVTALEKDHTLPPFFGLQLCVTGFDNLEQRMYLSEEVERQGATYNGDLTKSVTHLIAAAPKGQKYTFAKNWGITTVSLKWFEDSLQRGMTLDEKCYDPVIAEEEQGKGAVKIQSRPRTSLGKRGRDGDGERANGVDAKKRLRRTASSRLASQSQDMWQDISAHNVGMEVAENDQWKEDAGHSETHASNTTTGTGATVKREPKDITSEGLPGHNRAPEGLFSGIYILLHGFDEQRAIRLQQYLEPNGACVVKSLAQLEDASNNPLYKDRYLVVPHTLAEASLKLPDVPEGTVVATEWWVERCLHCKRLLNPTEDVLSRPLWKVGMPGFQDLRISTTGFGGVDLRQVAEVVKLMGASYQENVLPSSSVLISGGSSIKKEKAYYANKHTIPVVSADWLWTCLKTKEKASYEDFRLQLPVVDLKDLTGEPSTGSPASIDIPQQTSRGPTKKKDDPPSKRLSGSRKRHATPSLPLQAAKPSPPAAVPRPRSRLGGKLELPSMDSKLQSTTTPAAVPVRNAQPLQEVSPNLSPRKLGPDSKDDDDDLPVNVQEQSKPSSQTVSPTKPSSPPKPSSRGNDTGAQPPARPQHELSAEISNLLSGRNGASRPGSASGVDAMQKRKNRPLGRAPSGISYRSASIPAKSDRLSPEIPESEADGFAVSREAPAPPNTQLGYETSEAEAHRLHMTKKMGTTLQDDGGMQTLPSLGTVKDSVTSSDAGVGNRVKGRQRNK